MDLTIWLNKRVHIILINGFAYLGLVIQADENSLLLIDKNNAKVSLSKNSIDLIKEVKNGVF